MNHPKKSENEIRRMLKGGIICIAKSTMEYKDHKIEIEIDREKDENVKKTYYVTTPEGKTIFANISPYDNNPSDETIYLWIDAGCPEFDPPYGGKWNKENLNEFIQTDPMWYKDAFGNIHPTIKGKKFSTLINDKLKKIAAIGPVLPNIEPNIVCAWCQKPMGHDPELKDGPSHGICPLCKEKVLNDFFEDEKPKKTKKTTIAFNQTNMGAPVNNGTPSADTIPTTQQEQQIEDNQEVLYSQPFSNVSNWKKEIKSKPETDKALNQVLQKIRSKMPPESKKMLNNSNPKTRDNVKMIMDEMMKKPQEVSALRPLLERAREIEKQEEIDLAQQLNTKPTRTVHPNIR